MMKNEKKQRENFFKKSKNWEKFGKFEKKLKEKPSFFLEKNKYFSKFQLN